jgi:subtilisin-like proprotein convertase family protein
MNSNASWQARLLQSALSSWRRHRPVRLAGMTIVLALLGLALGTLCLRSAVVCADDVVELDLLATWFSDDQDATWSVAWGDVDGDGDLDLAAGNQLGPNKVYLNEGGTLQIAAAWASGDGDDTFGVAWGDVDADGDLDLVAGNYGQPNKLYLNDGGVLKTTPVWTDTVADDTRSVAWGDVNGDGLLDLAVGNWGYSKVYLNFKGALQTTPAWTTPVSEDTRSVAWGDVDGDGDLDLALGTSVSNKVYLNVGGVPQTIPAWVSGDSDNTFSVAWGDVDGDGDLDLAAGNTGGDPIKVYRNDGEGLGSGAWVLSGGAMSVAWGDVDEDGDLDLATTYWTIDRVYLNVAGGLGPSAAWTSGDEGSGQSVAWGDVDGDGDLDLAVGNFDSPNRVYVNQGGGLRAEASWLSGDDDVTFAVAWGDVDGDGDLDLAAGNRSRPNKVHLNDGGILRTSPVWTDTVSDDTWSVAWGDMDGDGRLDLAVGNYGQANKVYLGQGSALQATPAWTSLDSDGTAYVAWGDVDGDGDLDLAAANLGAPIKLYSNLDGILEEDATWESQDSGGGRSVAWGDVDGDGDLDLAVSSSGPNRVYLNRGGVLDPSAAWESADADDTEGIAWGDVDGDGDLDLAVGNWRGLNKVYLNQDGVLEVTASWTSGDSDYTYDVAWGDMDGDGDLDLAAGNLGGKNKVYRNDGVRLGTAAEHPWASDDESGTYCIVWGDADGDGDLDLAAGNSSEPNRVYLNGRPTHTPHPGQFPSVVLSLSGDPVQTFSQMVTALAPAGFYAVPGIRDARTIPMTYTLSHPAGSTVGYVRAFYSPDGGGSWRPAVATQTATTTLSTRLPIHYASPNTFPITISAASYVVSSTLLVLGAEDVADVDVWLNISHTWDGDLDVFVESPAGTLVELFTDVGSSGDGFLDTILDDEAAIPITSGTAPFSARYRPEGSLATLDGTSAGGLWTLWVTDDFLPADDGAILSWGINLQAGDGTHVYTWDTFASGFFGQSDDVVFRLEAYPQPVHTGIEGTYRYYDSVPGPYQRSYVAATTFPFRVRGTQARVISGTVPVSNAIVYRVPVGQSAGGHVLADASGEPFRTDSQGYLQGRGEIYPGDRLLALLPVSATEGPRVHRDTGRGADADGVGRAPPDAL